MNIQEIVEVSLANEPEFTGSITFAGQFFIGDKAGGNPVSHYTLAHAGVFCSFCDSKCSLEIYVRIG